MIDHDSMSLCDEFYIISMYVSGFELPSIASISPQPTTVNVTQSSVDNRDY